MKIQTQPEVDEMALTMTMQILELSFSGWVSEEKIDKILESIEANTLQEKIYLLTALSVFVRNRMPDNAFANLDSRESLLNAIQSRLDTYIVEEENND